MISTSLVYYSQNGAVTVNKFYKFSIWYFNQFKYLALAFTLLYFPFEGAAYSNAEGAKVINLVKTMTVAFAVAVSLACLIGLLSVEATTAENVRSMYVSIHGGQ